MAQNNLDRALSASSALPGLLLQAEQIAATVMRGLHGRRRPGLGETFWQFRQWQQGDSPRDIDWRQSAKRDDTFIRQREWEAAQSLWLWRDASRSMDFSSSPRLPRKKDFAEVLLLSAAMLALGAAEQVSLLGTDMPPQAHPSAAEKIFHRLPLQAAIGGGRPLPLHSHALLIGDFYQPLPDLSSTLGALAARQVRGVLLQVCDPAEETLDYSGRVKFLDIEDAAADPLVMPQVEAVRDGYRRAFGAHRESLRTMAEGLGWRFMAVRTDEKPEDVLLRLYDYMTARGAV